MKKKINWKKELMDFSFLAPSLILFLFIILVPLVRGVQYTFTNWDGLMPKLNYVGLKNYITVIHDKDLIQPICNTILFTLVTVVAINVIGLAVAMAVNKEFKGVNIIKSIIFIPLVVSLVLVSQMWMYVYSDFFSLLGWKSPLIDKKTSMLGLCIMSIWRESGLAMMIYLAGLKIFRLKSTKPQSSTVRISGSASAMSPYRSSHRHLPIVSLCGWQPDCVCMTTPS